MTPLLVEDQPLTSETAFVSLSLFNLLQFPLIILPSIVFAAVQASVSVKRLYDFLMAEELSTANVEHRAAHFPHHPPSDDTTIGATEGAVNPDMGVSREEDMVVVTDGTFAWSKKAPQPTLQNITFSVQDETLLAVVGIVGSGKSSLVSALLGDMEKLSGQVRVSGTVAFVPQQSWVMNTTLRENVTFGLPFDQEFYSKVIEACALLPDIEVLPAGDQTEIGEKGINLSGGQKQRVSLARAVYSRADVYLFDDPLSAVDAHVGKHIFDKVIGPAGLLKGAARILVTHAIHVLPKCDRILVLKEGRISEMGSYPDLVGRGAEFSRLITEFSSALSRQESAPQEEKKEEEKKKREESKSGGDDDDDDAGATKGGIMTKEIAEVGKVHFSVYRLYFGAMGAGPVAALLLLLVLGSLASVGTNVWLSYWSSQNSNDNIGLYLGVYSAFGLVFAVVVVAQAVFAYVVCAVRAASRLHDDMLATVLRVPMSFFDTTPLGRILNRFSKDQNTVDETLPRVSYDYFSTLFDAIGIICVVSFTTLYFLIAIIPLGALYLLIQNYYLSTSRELKRLDSVTRSPIYAHFSETLNGISTIRAYTQKARFLTENEGRINDNQKAYYPSVASNRWLATRLEFVGSMVVFLAAFFAVIEFGNTDSALVGLSVTYALSVTGTLNWLVRMSCDMEANIVAVERMKEYSSLKTEAPAIVPESRPPPSWPSKGEIEFNNYSTRYREGLDLVLREIKSTVRPSEKIGVVGRTGAGKSSLTLGLFRLIEPADGEIIIDGVNIATIGLHDLRSHLTIIPQDPVLFAGPLRENLDPFNEVSDDRIWAALESAHLKETVSKLEGKLDYKVVQGGENLSVGQRQLVCLARALVRKTKVLVLDEATAAVDVETDDIIQKTIREEFRECTIITIAHRINTIMDSDRILVLDKGRVAEFDTPQVLLANKGSIFYSLAKQSGRL